MESGMKDPYGLPTAPPLQQVYPHQSPYPGPLPPQPPPPYGHPGTTLSYGFQSPSPPYSSDPGPGYYQGYSNAPPGPYIQENALPGPYQQQNAPPGPYNQQNAPPGLYQQQNAPPGPYQQNAPPGPYNQPASLPGPYNQPASPPGPYNQPASPPGPYNQQNAPPGPYIQPHNAPGPYQQNVPPGPYQQNVPPGPYVPPPMPAGGYGLYPDLAQMQQPPQVPVSYGSDGTTTTTTPSVPLRPAPPLPPPPHYTAAPSVTDSGPAARRCSFAHLKEGEAPEGYVVQWRGGEGLQIFFLQKEGHVVSPKKPLIMSIYKKICVSESPEGMVEVHGCWRLKLIGGNTAVLHTSPDCYTFMDTSTCPSRVAVVVMPGQITKKMSEDLLNLLSELADLRNEEGGVVLKVTTGVATVYDDLTHKLNSAIKGSVPNAHKNTKWLRKNTGSLVRIGGNLVARGINLVADHIPANEKPQEESPAHTELLTGLKMYKKCLEEDTITYVD